MPGTVVAVDGAYRGARAGGTFVFKGIPFAAPPVGALRFRPPAPIGCSPGVTDALEYGRACLQVDPNKRIVGDEDCLKLNVWTPASGGPPRPVMFFIHGGGHIQGSASQQNAGTYIYDGQRMAERGEVVIVTSNYRLGALGFLALPSLAAESSHGSSGNYGVLDNMEALRWVQRNIAAFGGDPTRVMIFGESAGAVEVCALVASPLAKDLFSRALMESGGCAAASRAAHERDGAELVQNVDCQAAADIPACLRTLPATDVINARPGSVSIADGDLGSYGPTIDGYVLKGQPFQIIAAGTHNHVPMVIGSNSDETSRSVSRIASCEAYASEVGKRFSLLSSSVLNLYPCASYATPTKALIAATSDARFICIARRDARAFAKGQTSAVYRYFLTQGVDAPALRDFGAWHGLDVLFVFQRTDIAGYQPTGRDTDLGEAMLKYWTRFAATGDPNGSNLPAWPRYESSRDPVIVLSSPVKASEGVRTKECDYWESLPGQTP